MIVALPALAGCAAGDDPANEDAMGETESAVSGTCAAARGRGVINRYQKALHDSLAFAEGTENDGKDGYDVLFTHRKVQLVRASSEHAHLFGRALFDGDRALPVPEDDLGLGRGARNFEPENQEKGAEYLVKTVRRANVPTSPADGSVDGHLLSAVELAHAALGIVAGAEHVGGVGLAIDAAHLDVDHAEECVVVARGKLGGRARAAE